jgi:uncharacterized protein YjbI with pentapeptide repeats
MEHARALLPSPALELIRETKMEVAWHVWQARPPHPSLTVIVKATFTIVPDGPCTLADVQALPTGDQHHDDDPERSLRYASDLEPLKPRGECFLVGSFHAPGGQPVPHSKVAFQIGAVPGSSVRKQLAVYGDRVWAMGRTTPPTPITKLPLAWELSFGGPGIADNPTGRGIAPIVVDGQPRYVLPNIEDPMALLSARESRPKPVGCAPIARTWASRLRLAGTYGAAWKEKRYPWFPEDIDWRFFCGAPLDQQIEGFWRGDEEIILRHLHPKHASLRTVLPGLRPQAYLVPKAGGRLRDMSLSLDTLVVDTDEGLVYAIWRGVAEVAKEDLSDIEHLYVVEDEPGARRVIEHNQMRYRAKLGAIAAEQEAEQAEQAPAMPSASESAVHRLNLQALLGDAPGAKWAHLDQEQTMRSDEALERALQDAIAAHRGKQHGLRPIFENAIDLPVPPSESRRLTPEEEVELAMQSSLGDLLVDEDDQRVAEIRAAAAEGRSLAGEDLSGLDLSGVDFGAADLRGALLVRTNLSGARFERARLDDAVLSEAEISQAGFDGCSLVRVDLTSCRAHAVRMHDCDLTDAVLSEAFFREARFSSCKLVRTDLRKSDASAAELRDCVLDGADLSGATLEAVVMRDTSLVDASLEGGVKARGIVLDGCNASLLRASEEADFEEASFRKAVLEGARFSGARMRKANFGLAKLSRADFSDAFLLEATLTGCDLRFARFDRATLIKAALLRSDLMQARLPDANLRQADLRGANLFQAELLGAKLEDAKLDLALIAGTRIG